jgi:oligopeptidase A
VDSAASNPLLDLNSNPIPFDRICAEHVRPAIAELLARAKADLRRIAETGGGSPPTYAGTLGALEDATEALSRAMSVVSHLESVATTPELRDAYNAVQPEVSAFYTAIPLDAALYRTIRAFAETAEAATLDPVRRRHLDKTLDQFRRHGAELDDAGKKELEAIDVELSTLTTRFSQNLLDATNAFELVISDEKLLAGLPPSAVAAARASAQQKGLAGYRFTLHAPSVMAVLTYLDDREIREKVWWAYNTCAASGAFDNRPLVRRILELRARKARLLGYRDFADLVLADRMAKSGDAAARFVRDLEAKTRDAFERETRELEAFRREALGPGAGPMQPWDVAYWAEKQRKALYDFDEEELRPYFEADRVLDGLFEIARRLFEIAVEPVSGLPVWDSAVRVFRVYDRLGERLGVFYVDLHPRENKRGGAWMAGLVTGGPIEGGGFRPHAGVFCANASPPVDGRPALLTHEEVETLFHEFGHLLHHLLSRVPVRSLAGTQVAWDFVELPSQIMENWTWEREALDLFARHWQTGEPIPEHLFSRMKRARTYRAASAQMRQLGLATVDLVLHRNAVPERDEEVIETARRVMERFSPTPLPPGYAMITGFSHLFGHPVGYAAGYYSYKWAEVLDADAFARFRREGLFSARVGAEFRDRVLARGDSDDPMKLFVDFVGREPRLEPLLERIGLLSPGAGGEAQPQSPHGVG